MKLPAPKYLHLRLLSASCSPRSPMKYSVTAHALKVLTRAPTTLLLFSFFARVNNVRVRERADGQAKSRVIYSGTWMRLKLCKDHYNTSIDMESSQKRGVMEPSQHLITGVCSDLLRFKMLHNSAYTWENSKAACCRIAILFIL